MLKKCTIYIFFALFLSGCSGTTVLESSAYLDSKAKPTLKLPADMDSSVLNSTYPVPEIPETAGTTQGKTHEELEVLKTPPNVLDGL